MARILVADDQDSSRILLTSTLSAIGHDVVEAADGQAAAARCADDPPPDLAILDLTMPGLSGLEVAEQIADRIPFIVLTVDSAETTVRRCVDAGAYAYLVKPIESTTVQPMVQAALARHRDHNNVQRAFANTKIINQAIGIMMERHRLVAAEAESMLRQEANRNRGTLADTAHRVVEATERLNALRPQ